MHANFNVWIQTLYIFSILVEEGDVVKDSWYKIFVAIVLIILFMPLIQMTSGLVKYAPVDEARIRKPKPEFSLVRVKNDFKGLVHEFDQWFNDNYGFRDLLIKLGTQIDYSLFDYSDKVHIGKEGFLYYRSVCDTELSLNYMLYKQHRVHEAYERWKKVADIVKGTGITMLLVINPMKTDIYPEYLPETVPTIEDHAFHKLNNILINQNDFLYINVRERLLELKRKLQIFHKTDFHWTDPAAYYIAEEIVNMLGKEANCGEHVWRHPLEIERKQISGGQARFMPLLVYPSENSIFSKKNWADDGKYDYSQKGNYEFIYRSSDPDKLPPTVFLGNSFGDAFMRNGMETYFKVFYKVDRSLDTEEVLRNLPEGTRFVIVQVLELSVGRGLK